MVLMASCSANSKVDLRIKQMRKIRCLSYLLKVRALQGADRARPSQPQGSDRCHPKGIPPICWCERTRHRTASFLTIIKTFADVVPLIAT